MGSAISQPDEGFGSSDPSLSAIEPNPWLKFPADLLLKVREVARSLGEDPWNLAARVFGKTLDFGLGKAPETLEQAAYGFPPWTGTGETLRPKEGALDVANLVPWGTISSLAKTMLTKAAAPGLMGLAGTLRPKGDPSLMLHRGGGSLRESGVGWPPPLREELSSPSIMITGQGQAHNQFFGETNLIPREGAFDPAYTPEAQLYAQDVYTTRGEQWPGSHMPTPMQRAWGKLLSSPRQAEGSLGWWLEPELWAPRQGYTPSSTAQMLGPQFSSYAEYEASKKGAGRLVEDYNPVEGWSNSWKGAFLSWQRNAPSKYRHMAWNEALVDAAQSGDTRAQRLIYDAQTAPSNYAELKISGQVPLDPSLWAGVLVRGDPGSAHTARLLKDLDARGLNPRLSSGDDKTDFLIAQALQDAAGPVRGPGWPETRYTLAMERARAARAAPPIPVPPAPAPTPDALPGGLHTAAEQAHKAMLKHPPGDFAQWYFDHAGGEYKVMPHGEIFQKVSAGDWQPVSQLSFAQPAQGAGALPIAPAAASKEITSIHDNLGALAEAKTAHDTMTWANQSKDVHTKLEKWLFHHEGQSMSVDQEGNVFVGESKHLGNIFEPPKGGGGNPIESPDFLQKAKKALQDMQEVNATYGGPMPKWSDWLFSHGSEMAKIDLKGNVTLGSKGIGNIHGLPGADGLMAAHPPVGVWPEGGKWPINDEFSAAASKAWTPTGNAQFMSGGVGWEITKTGQIYKEGTGTPWGRLDLKSWDDTGVLPPEHKHFVNNPSAAWNKMPGMGETHPNIAGDTIEQAALHASDKGLEKFTWKGTEYGIYTDEHGSSVWNESVPQGKAEYEWGHPGWMPPNIMPKKKAGDPINLSDYETVSDAAKIAYSIGGEKFHWKGADFKVLPDGQVTTAEGTHIAFIDTLGPIPGKP